MWKIQISIALCWRIENFLHELFDFDACTEFKEYFVELNVNWEAELMVSDSE